MNSAKTAPLQPSLWGVQVGRFASWRDFLQMCKPRVVLLMLLCTAVGMCLASQSTPSLYLVLCTLVGVALMAGSAAAVNHIADAKIDARMARTRARPVPGGRVSVVQGAVFSITIGAIGFWVLHATVNPLTAWLNLGSWVGYGLIYTLYLKRATPQNIVIGGLFGAAPPLFGWTAVTNSIDPFGLWLVAIIFLWTPPHFWALALERKDEYAAAKIPMLPVIYGEPTTRVYILVYTVLLVGLSLAPAVVGGPGGVYLFGAITLGAGFLYWSIVLLGNKTKGAPMATFRYSIVYLMALFVMLLVDHYVDGAGLIHGL